MQGRGEHADLPDTTKLSRGALSGIEALGKTKEPIEKARISGFAGR
jgi:hypothetical protein